MTQGPWYITPSAVRELLAIKGKRDTAEQRELAEAELLEIAIKVTTGDQQGRELDSGATQYRGPRPLRLRLTVVPSERVDGPPVLVRVQPDHEGRAGPYTQSAPERQTGHDKRDKRRP